MWDKLVGITDWQQLWKCEKHKANILPKKDKCAKRKGDSCTLYKYTGLEESHSCNGIRLPKALKQHQEMFTSIAFG